MMDILLKLAERFKEPSSYAGLMGLLTMFGINATDAVAHSVSMILAGISGVVAILLQEKK